MLLHRGIGLAKFNALSSTAATSAVFEGVNSMCLARQISRGRPFADHAAMRRWTESSLAELDGACREQLLEALHLDACEEPELVTLVIARIERMLGPEGGYPTYGYY